MLLALLLLPAAAAEPPPPSEDLPAMARRYGLTTVAAVAHSASNGDLTIQQVHTTLRELGLDRLQVPVTVDPALSPLQGVGPVTGCGWNQGVTCALALPAGSPTRFLALCHGDDGPIDDVTLRVVADPEPSRDTPGVGHIDDLLPCWSAGGTRIHLTATPQGSDRPIVREGWPATDARRALAPHRAALDDCASRDGLHLELSRTGGEPPQIVVREGPREDVQATTCARRALAAVELPAGATLSIPLPPPLDRL